MWKELLERLSKWVADAQRLASGPLELRKMARAISIALLLVISLPIVLGFLRDAGTPIYESERFELRGSPWGLKVWLSLAILEDGAALEPGITSKRFAVKLAHFEYEPRLDALGNPYCLRGIYINNRYAVAGNDNLIFAAPLARFTGSCENHTLTAFYGLDPVAVPLNQHEEFYVVDIGNGETELDLDPEIRRDSDAYHELVINPRGVYPFDRAAMDAGVFGIVEAAEGSQVSIAPNLDTIFLSNSVWKPVVEMRYPEDGSVPEHDLAIIEASFGRPLTPKLFTLAVLGVILVLILALVLTDDRNTVLEISIGILLGLWSVSSFLIPERVPEVESLAYYAIPYLYLLFGVAVAVRLAILPLLERALFRARESDVE